MQTKRSQVLALMRNHPDWSVEEVAKELDISRYAVYTVASQHGYTFRSKEERTWRMEQDRLKKLGTNTGHMTMHDIAHKLGITYSAAFTFCRKYNIPYKLERKFKDRIQPDVIKEECFQYQLPSDYTWLI